MTESEKRSTTHMKYTKEKNEQEVIDVSLEKAYDDMRDFVVEVLEVLHRM